MTTIRVGVLGLTVLLAACSGSPSTPSATAPTPSTPAATASAQATALAPSPSGDLISGKFDVDGRTAFIECKGTGSPTVIFEAGLDSDSRSAAGVVGELAATTRTCRYDRAGLGFSQSHSGGGDLSAGDRARDLHALLEVVGVEGPYVLVGFSYGGMIVRTFTDQFPDEVAGLVFLDATHEDAWAPGSWYEQFPQGKDGHHAVDRGRTRDELGAADDLGDRPTIVLTAGRISGDHERHWTPIQDKLAALSSNGLHMVATESGHDIRADRPELVHESILAVVAAVRGTALPACGPRFEAVGAECLDGTMADLLATWDAQRAEVVPAAGKLPPGRYGFEQDDVSITMTLGKGRLEAAMRHPNGTVENFTAAYAALGDEVTFLWPFDWRIPRTSGVNTARWTVDPDGTLHFVQVDSELTEGWIEPPWVPIPA